VDETVGRLSRSVRKSVASSVTRSANARNSFADNCNDGIGGVSPMPRFATTEAKKSPGRRLATPSDDLCRLPPVGEFIHTCYRVTDPDRSLAFYEALGFEKRRELPIRDEAVNYFLGVPGTDGPELELTYNFETPDGGYELGTGYGHIAVTVDDMDTALSSLGEKGIEPERPPYTVREGGSRICFVRDPDGYRVELIERA
jgi:lactoylglutathione lyase